MRINMDLNVFCEKMNNNYIDYLQWGIKNDFIILIHQAGDGSYKTLQWEAWIN